MARPGKCGTGAGDEFVLMLRHLSDPSCLAQQRFRENRRKDGSSAASRKLAVSRPWLCLAHLQVIEKAAQDLLWSMSVALCLIVLTLVLRAIAVARIVVTCICCSQRSGKVGKLTSLHWSFTNSVFQLQARRRGRKIQQAAVRNFLRRHQISSGLSIRVGKHVDRWQPQQVRAEDLERVQTYSMYLVSEIMQEMGSPPLMEHSFFVSLRTNHVNLLNQLSSEALVPVFKSGSETVFTVGDSCGMMYIIVNGRAQYSAQLPAPRDAPAGSPGTQVRKVLQSGQWLSEAALWTGWVHRGQLRSLSEIFFIGIDAGRFARVISSHKAAHAFAAGYARKFVEGLNRSVQSDLTEAGSVEG
eukprot:TRINITY_DN7467_c1_g1_i1.p1 TRINITY_DN7467_c1_g1~~TRINITY_DN7467_c1_g1_i1.p1  ORF type:complete len:377 (-),score=53.97 TRINITY_DN7467_c1_g1_i1:136-1203(-)